MAGTYTGATVGASTMVSSNCTITTAAVNFGSYDPIGTNKTNAVNNGNGQVGIRCVQGTAPTIGLDLGANASGSTRRMKNTTSADYLSYELYWPPNNTPGTACTFPASTVWGNAGASLFTPSAPPNKNLRTYNICATVPAAQDPAIGTYSDTVTATVNF